MVGIHGIGGPSDPVNPRQGPGRVKPAEVPSAAASDDVQISAEAAAVSAAGKGSALRDERIERAKENIEQGVYRIQEVVLQVADRIAQFVD